MSKDTNCVSCGHINAYAELFKNTPVEMRPEVAKPALLVNNEEVVRKGEEVSNKLIYFLGHEAKRTLNDKEKTKIKNLVDNILADVNE